MTGKYDVVIVGAGAAGMTAGLYSARNGLKTAIISKDIGGTANSILVLENWPGFYGSGAELMKKFYDETKKYEIDFIMSEVDSIEKNKNEFLIKTKKGNLISKTIIIATGTERRKLKIPGEERFIGKGVSYCVTCDAFFFKNKTVTVVGGSDCAATSAVALTNLAKKVYIVYRGEKLRCEEINEERLKKNKNVEIIYKAIPLEIKGKEKVEDLVIKQGDKKREIKTDGIFVEIGSTPLVKFIKNLNLKLDKENYIVVDGSMKTSVEGIFAAGDVTNSEVKQVVTASAQGAIAGKGAHDYLRLK
ncbi:FAD-dependent oxidoreductase [Candidatus Pacearchaeota archaeon]|jgi:thioredoxin reductase (NADPH)|nr:FAD-dependent oxidoreductase [Candidatus Pacearchaeota archaeon]